MKRTTRFVASQGTVAYRLASGEEFLIPVVPGILKHPTLDALRAMLVRHEVVKKYTVAALRRAPWPVVRQFPRSWLLRCLPEARLAPGRRAALAFLLGGSVRRADAEASSMAQPRSKNRSTKARGA